jgi:hypothetical protein
MRLARALWAGMCCGVITGTGTGLALGTAVDDPALSSVFILGIFVRIAESNPFFALP